MDSRPIKYLGILWEDVLQGYGVVECSKVKVRNWRRKRFWEDNWVGDVALKEEFPRLYWLSCFHNYIVADMVWGVRDLYEFGLWGLEGFGLAMTWRSWVFAMDFKVLNCWEYGCPNLVRSANSYFRNYCGDSFFLIFEPAVIWKAKVRPKVNFLAWATHA